MRINVLNAAFLLIGCCDCARFTHKRRRILWHAGLTGRSRWACLIRVTRWSRLTRLPLTCRSGLSTLTRRTLLALRLGERGINVAIDVSRFMIVVTAIAVAISRIVHVIHL